MGGPASWQEVGGGVASQLLKVAKVAFRMDAGGSDFYMEMPPLKLFL
jgi:hypothetical protein